MNKPNITYPKVDIKNTSPMWWSGDKRVEPYMENISEVLDKYPMAKSMRTDIYNRCYEAVYKAIKDYND